MPVDYTITNDLLPGDVHVSCYLPTDTSYQVEVASVCQRANNPSIIDVTVNITGNLDQIALVPGLTVFAVPGAQEYVNDAFHGSQTTDGDYYILNPLQDSSFSGWDFFPVNGAATFAFSADMSDHLSSWSAETKVYIHPTFAKPDADLSSFGITWPPTP